MITGTVLLADDDRAIRTVLSQALTRAGARVRSTGAASTLWRWIEEGVGDAVLTDVMMPDGDALDLLPAIKKRRPDLPVVVMSAQNTVMTAIRAAQAGAYEYIPKPFDLREVVNTLGRALSSNEPSEEDAESGVEEASVCQIDQLPLIGRSPAMQQVYRVMARLMHTDLTVMISGESGTGKELVARALHNYGRRKSGPFVAVNMAAIPKELIESELFGHEKGAFTGATERARGKFEIAQGGTLFLDEIGDMPAEAQTRLLRVLQEGEFVTVGGRKPIKTDVRIIAATHQDLRRLIREGLFREDLYYRINVVPIRLPALRERADDVPDLARAFLRKAQDDGLPAKSISRDALDLLRAQPWPGNVRELENLVRRLAALCPEDLIDARAVGDELSAAPLDEPAIGANQEAETLSASVERHVAKLFQRYEPGAPPPGLYDRILQELELPLITLTLSAAQGNQVRAAEILGINRNTLRKKIRELDIQVTRGKKLM
ncbi:MAG: nitrogen regulation protein NR(I) [Neomegalonema sp.]|nr:nitrogen regulation protein NR(I) [Neomegalonema sp.]